MPNNLNILSWNVRGIMSSSICLSDMLSHVKCDIAIVSEHKLKPNNISFMDSIHPNYLSFVRTEHTCSSEKNRFCTQFSRYLGKGGVGILYKKELKLSICELTDIDSSRIIGLKIKRSSDRPLYIFGAYLPADNVIQSYAAEMGLLEDLVAHFSSIGDVIVGGDFNASCYNIDSGRVNMYKSSLLKDFIMRNYIGSPRVDFESTGSQYTFIQTKSTLDFIFCSNSLCKYVELYHVFEEGSHSCTSDHLPVFMVLDFDVKNRIADNHFQYLPAWHKADSCKIREYESFVSKDSVALLERNLECVNDTDDFCSDLNCLLHDAASQYIPVSKYKPYLKPEWTPKVKQLHNTERQKRNIWLSEGRPRGMCHESYRNYKRAKRNFRNELQSAHDDFMTKVFKDIDEASECDVRLFWRLIKRQRPRSSRIYSEIETENVSYSNPVDIANCFAKHFENIYNPQDIGTFNDDFFRSIENSYSELKTVTKLLNEKSLPGGDITIDEISNIISDLKRRKAPGIDRIQSEHIIYGGTGLKLCIQHLFNSIIKIGEIPTSWKKDIIVPIHKGHNKPKKSPNSYRPIALLPCMLKIFEKLLLYRIKSHILSTVEFPNIQQQGFQQKLGCLTASFNLQETIHHNIEQGSPVYVAFLDTQKAFDTVWRHGLMCKLSRLGISGRLWTLIDDCHTNTSCSVVVNHINSSWFPVSQGVRQGGILSTFLYLVFINDLLHEIQNQCPNMGIYNIASSTPALADDISCIALSPSAIQKILNTAFVYSKNWRFQFNADKSSVLRFSPSTAKNNASPIWYLGTEPVYLSKTYNHLGILLQSKLVHTEKIANACRKGRQAYYALKIQEHLNPDTVSRLYNRIVLPSTLYGCELWSDLCQRDLQALNTLQHFICKHAMGLPKVTRSDICESLLGLLPISSEIDKRKLLFLGRLCELDTKTLTKKIFLQRLFTYLQSPELKHFGFIHDVFNLLYKYNLHRHFLLYLQDGYFPPKSLWKTSVKTAIIDFHLDSRHKRMLSDPSFQQFNKITAGRPPQTIWKIPSDIHEIEICKFITKLWSFPHSPPTSCLICGKYFTNVFEHVSTTCVGTVAIQDAWWNTVIDLDIVLSAELCGLCHQDLYLFLLGARMFTVNLSHYDEPGLHLLNFRFLRDAAACYNRQLRLT